MGKRKAWDYCKYGERVAIGEEKDWRKVWVKIKNYVKYKWLTKFEIKREFYLLR